MKRDAPQIFGEQLEVNVEWPKKRFQENVQTFLFIKISGLSRMQLGLLEKEVRNRMCMAPYYPAPEFKKNTRL